MLNILRVSVPLAAFRTCEALPTIQPENGGGAPRVHFLKDYNGYRAVFLEQGASPSQMAAPLFSDTVPRLLGIAGEANDAVSAFTQVHTIKERPQVLMRLSPSRRPKQWDSIEEPVVLHERNLNGHPLAGLLWE